MIKLVYCLRRRPELSREEFLRYWRETHAPLAEQYAKTLKMRRYVQCHALDTPVNAGLRASRGGPEGYDGVAEIWLDRVEDLGAATATPEGREAARVLLEDERRFIDLANSPMWLCEEHPILGA